jgi:diguanylate cyclase (GGDEF)-like protein
MESPYFYIIFSLMISSAGLSVVFYMAWLNFGRKEHALTWSLAFLAGALQWLCVLNEDLFPTREAYLLLESALSMALVTLGLRGHCQRTRCKHLPKNLWPLAMSIYAVTVWHIVVNPHVGIRMSIVPAYAAVALFLSALMIVNYRERTRPAEWAAVVFIIIFALTQAVSAGLAYKQGPTGDTVFAEIFAHFAFLTLPAGYMTMSMFIILMIASDISAQMKKLATRDQLTGLLNRRGFTEYGERAFSTAKRAALPLSVIMTDIDRFKNINDKFGHAAGDAALVHFARMVSEYRRSEDVVARVGGEEFALLLPGTELRDAMALADQLCAKVGSTPMDVTGIGMPITSSFGVSAVSEKDESLDDLVLRADRALYRSKRAGRNQVDLESSQLMLASDGKLKPVSSA